MPTAGAPCRIDAATNEGDLVTAEERYVAAARGEDTSHE